MESETYTLVSIVRCLCGREHKIEGDERVTCGCGTVLNVTVDFYRPSSTVYANNYIACLQGKHKYNRAKIIEQWWK